MIKIGITGGIGSGKTTVSKVFELFDIPVYIADIESKKIVESSPIIREKLIKLFGEHLYSENTLNKALLASYIFSNEEHLRQVNAIIHPEVAKDYNNWLAKHQDKQAIVHEAAILFESGFDKLVDKVITVYTPIELRIARTIKRDQTSAEEVKKRIKSQMPDEEKCELSDFIIVNDNSQSVIKQVANIISELKIDYR